MTGTYYGCGLRVGFVPNYGGNSLCGATGGWPNSYCGNELSYSPVCEDNLCSSDCQSYGQNGGYCGDRDNCLCFKQVFKTENNEDSALSLQINEKSNPWEIKRCIYEIWVSLFEKMWCANNFLHRGKCLILSPMQIMFSIRERRGEIGHTSQKICQM